MREFADLAHRAGALAFVDGVAFSPHGLPDVRELGVDAYYFSLYKVYGPHLGALYLRREVNAALPNQGHFFNDGLPEKRFTPAGPDHAQIAAVNGVADYFDAIADHHGLGGKPATERAAGVRSLFRTHETALLQPLLDFLAQHPKVRLIGRTRAADRAPTVSFTAQGKSSAAIASELAAAGFGVGVGNFYAYRLVQALGIDPDDGAVRVSFVHYTSKDEVDRLVTALDGVLAATREDDFLRASAHCSWRHCRLSQAEPPKPPTVEELLRPAVIRDMALSRDGRKLAIVGKFGDKRDVVAIVETSRLGDPAGIRKFTIGQDGVHTPLWVMWANDTRLLIAQRVGVTGAFLVAGRQIQAIDIDGGNPVSLFADAPMGARFGLNLSRVVDVTPDDPDHIVMAAWNRDSTDLFQVNVNTGLGDTPGLRPFQYGRLGYRRMGGRPCAMTSTAAGPSSPFTAAMRRIPRTGRASRRSASRKWRANGSSRATRLASGRSMCARAATVPTRATSTSMTCVRARPAESSPTCRVSTCRMRFAIDGEYAGAWYVADTTTYVLRDAKLQEPLERRAPLLQGPRQRPDRRDRQRTAPGCCSWSAARARPATTTCTTSRNEISTSSRRTGRGWIRTAWPPSRY